MNRTQKKCLVASASLHLLLCLILIVAPGFFSKKHEEINLPVLEIIPSKLIDDALNGGGGNPNIKQARAPIIDANAPMVKPEPAAPPRPQQQKQPDPVKPSTKPDTKSTPSAKNEPAETQSRPTIKDAPGDKVKVNLSNPLNRSSTSGKPSTSKNTSTAKNSKDSDSQQGDERSKAAAQASAQLSKSLQALRSGLSGGTEIELPGPGGEAYANWSQVVKSIYDHAWSQPNELDDKEASVEVTITIRRDGSVVHADTYITRKSGIKLLDDSVKRTLDRVDEVPRFPEGAKDLKRTLNILFKLKSNRLHG